MSFKHGSYETWPGLREDENVIPGGPTMAVTFSGKRRRESEDAKMLSEGDSTDQNPLAEHKETLRPVDFSCDAS